MQAFCSGARYARLVTNGKRRGPYAKTAAQRENILAAARRSFARFGYSGSSMRGIAEEAGMTFAGLRHHFPTKDELLIAVLEHRDQEHQDQQRQLHGSAYVRDLTRLLMQSLGEPAITEVFTTLSAEAVARDHPAHEFFTTRYERIRHQFADEVRRAEDEGWAPRIGSDDAAVLIAAVMDGLQLQWLLDERIDAQRIFGEFMRIAGLEAGTAFAAPAGSFDDASEHPQAPDDRR